MPINFPKNGKCTVAQSFCSFITALCKHINKDDVHSTTEVVNFIVTLYRPIAFCIVLPGFFIRWTSVLWLCPFHNYWFILFCWPLFISPMASSASLVTFMRHGLNKGEWFFGNFAKHMIEKFLPFTAFLHSELGRLYDDMLGEVHWAVDLCRWFAVYEHQTCGLLLCTR